jgi:hypothetical protein
MTDGPQKSLPMSNAFRRAAAKMANPNCTLQEVSDAMLAALNPWGKQAFIGRVLDILTPEGQGTLFSGDPAALRSELKILERYVAGSSFNRSIIDFCSARINCGQDGSGMLAQAVAHALAVDADSHLRGMAEHWRRAAHREAANFQRRCTETYRAMDFDTIAREVLSPGGFHVRPPSTRLTEIEAGVPL